jgi:hypothetical protein
MKNSLKWAAVAFAACVMVVASGSNARADQAIATATIPFPFVVGDAHLPAGSYVIRQVDDDGDVLAIASASGHRFSYAVAEASTPFVWSNGPAKLVFDKIGSQLVLARVVSEDGSEHDLSPAK